MPPKFRFTKEQIIQAALELTREGGIASVTAKSVGEKLNSSVKLVFGQFTNMEEVKDAVQKTAYNLWRDYMTKAMGENQYPPYKASGMAYIHFAKEERELFKLLFMRDRSLETYNDKEDIKPLIEEIQRATGLNEDDAYMVHTEMWMFVHGIATMVATSYLEWDDQLIGQFLTDAYLGMRYRFSEEGKKHALRASDL